MKPFSTIGRVCALASTLFLLAGCDGNPTENKPSPDDGDRYLLFEPTREVSATSYYKEGDRELVTYGRLRTEQATGNTVYEQSGLRAYGPGGSVTIVKEDEGFFLVLDTEDEPFSMAYRVREYATTAHVEAYVIDEKTGQGIAVGDTVVPRMAAASFDARFITGNSATATAASDLPGSVCNGISDLTSAITTGISYITYGLAIFTGAVLVAKAFPAISVLAAFGGGVALAYVESNINIFPDRILDYLNSTIQGALTSDCPDEFSDRERDCPRCQEPLRTCIVDPATGNPVRCCIGGDCKDEQPEGDDPPPANSAGDVHIRTPDGLAYDFQGAGEYLLMESSDGRVVVQSRQEPWRGSYQVTVNTAVAMKVAGDRVGVYLERSPQLVVNGTPTPFSGGRIDLPNGGAVLDAAPGYLIRWPNGFLVSVRPQSSFLDIGMSRPENSTLSYRGLLGNLNGDPADDFFARGGQSLTFPVDFEVLYDVFGASWQITQSESLFEYEAGESTATFALPGFPGAPVTIDDLDPEVYQRARAICRAAGVSHPVLLNDCILDIGLTGESVFVRSATNAPAPERELDVDYPDGLIGSYYDGYFNDDLSFFGRNAPILTRVDNPIDFRDDSASWDLGGTPELADLESYSVVWKGRLIVPASGTYTLYLNSDDASYLFLGEAARNPSTSNATINNGTAHPLRERSVQVTLEAGAHPLMIVYGEEARNNIVQLFWSSTERGIPKQIVTALGRWAGQ